LTVGRIKSSLDRLGEPVAMDLDGGGETMAATTARQGA
jgi:hypothetical protein